MKPKGRPNKTREISSKPDILQFSPRGKPGRPDEVELSVDQFEALKLADYLSLKHIEAAEKMKISRPTFSRILKKARAKLSCAIVEGRIIRIKNI